MNLLRLDHVVKEYKDKRAVDAVSFGVRTGKIFGLLGPNGAGKTSIIRMITNITRPDAGHIYYEDEPMERHHIENIGYLPEERGLYKKMKVGEQLIYLARIKGMDKQSARTALQAQAEKYEISGWWDKKIEELSKGMQQKIQFIATVVHKPKLLILDEPFTGLDPINTNLIKDDIRQMAADGCTIIFSTHRMEQVEEICEDIVLISDGKNILEGSVDQIKQDLKEYRYTFSYMGEFRPVNAGDILEVKAAEGHGTLRTTSAVGPEYALRKLLDAGNIISGFAEVLPGLNEIFIRTVEKNPALV